MKRGSILLLTLLVLSISSVSAAQHNASEFNLKIDGTTMNLQAAYNNHLLNGTHTYSEPDTISNPGHTISQIIISTYQGETDFLTALQDKRKLIGGTYTYTTPLIYGHYASEITFSDGRSLQDLIWGASICTRDTINDFNFECGPINVPNGCGKDIITDLGSCTYGNCNASNMCETECNPGNTQLRNCNVPSPYDAACVNYNTQKAETCQQDYTWPKTAPSCDISSTKPRGTDCGTQIYEACDSAGSCEGYAGTGCSNCPSGTRSPWLSDKVYCDIDETIYQSRYKPFVNAGIYPTTTLGDWTSFSNSDPLCSDKVCPGGVGIFGCKVTTVQTGTKWQIKPVRDTCIASSWTPATRTICNGNTFTQSNGCDTRTATGTKDCSCTPSCPSSGSCGSYLGSDGCGGSCGYGNTCSGGLNCDYISGSWACCPSTGACLTA